MNKKVFTATFLAICLAFFPCAKTRGGYFMDAWEKFSEIKVYGMSVKSPNRPFPVTKDKIRDMCEWQILIKRYYAVFGNFDYEKIVEINKSTKDDLQIRLCVDCLDGAGEVCASYCFDKHNYIDAVAVLSKAMFSRDCSVSCETP